MSSISRLEDGRSAGETGCAAECGVQALIEELVETRPRNSASWRLSARRRTDAPREPCRDHGSREQSMFKKESYAEKEAEELLPLLVSVGREIKNRIQAINAIE